MLRLSELCTLDGLIDCVVCVTGRLRRVARLVVLVSVQRSITTWKETRKVCCAICCDWEGKRKHCGILQGVLLNLMFCVLLLCME